MLADVALYLLIPLAGTTLGSACVLFLKNGLKSWVQRALAGFAAGVMVAASIWSLLDPALEESAHLAPGPSCRRWWAFGWASGSCCCWT